MKRIAISRHQYTIVSDQDYEFLNQFSWSCNPQGQGYVVRKGRRSLGEKRTVHMHRVIMNAQPGMQIDHINGNSLDNRRENLRIVNIQKNAFNRKKPSVTCTSIYKGVLKRKNNNKWEARIKYNDRSIYLGQYEDEQEAAVAYNYAAQMMFGEFSRPNILNSQIKGTDMLKKYVYEKCLNAIQKYGWHPDTGAFCLQEINGIG